MNIKQKIYQYRHRMEDDLSAYYDLLSFYKSLENEMVDDIKNGLDIKAKLKVRDQLNQFLADEEPYELEETDFYQFNDIAPNDQSIYN